MNNDQRVRSRNDDIPVTINFINESSWKALLLWCDYEGRRVLYASIGAGRSCSLFSFLTHPWLAVDSTSFYPMPLRVTTRKEPSNTLDATSTDSPSVFTPIEQYISPQTPGLICASIQLPVLSLAELCKRRVQTVYAPEHIRQLDLPHFLINSLLRPLAVPWDRLATNRS
ncbi:hypothetical protein AHF37_05901 [Paragonimus kellicotti]|nr:hypothetical protein AHF37_05901 [Paragonimus kellicotti]